MASLRQSLFIETMRDLTRLRTVLKKPLWERSPADKYLLLRYAGTVGVLRRTG